MPITARLLANLIETAGADRILTVDLHAGQIQGFFNIPVDELTALYILGRYFKERDLSEVTVLATDVGGAKRARDLARLLEAPLAVVDKERMGNEERISSMALIGDVAGRNVIIPDDEILTGGTILAAAKLALERGARSVTAACVHPILSDRAVEKICGSEIQELVVTDTIPLPPQKQHEKITVLTRRAHARRSDHAHPHGPVRRRALPVSGAERSSPIRSYARTTTIPPARFAPDLDARRDPRGASPNRTDCCGWTFTRTDATPASRSCATSSSFHPLTIDDCYNTLIDPPKVDDYGTYLFVIVHDIHYHDEQHVLSTSELNLYIGANYVVSVHRAPVHAVDDVRRRADAHSLVLQRGAAFLAHALIDVVVDDFHPVVEQLDEEVAELEERVLDDPRRETLQAVLTLKRNAQRLKRSILPQRDVMNRFSRNEYPHAHPAARDHVLPRHLRPHRARRGDDRFASATSATARSTPTCRPSTTASTK